MNSVWKCGAMSSAELKRWITVTAPVLSSPRIPRRRARRRNQAETEAMNWRSTTVVSAGSTATYDRRVLNELASLRFVEDRRNIVILGPVGVGKTFLANVLGHVCCRAGFHVRLLGHPRPDRTSIPLRTRNSHANGGHLVVPVLVTVIQSDRDLPGRAPSGAPVNSDPCASFSRCSTALCSKGSSYRCPCVELAPSGLCFSSL
jgi:hypothetical protein